MTKKRYEHFNRSLTIVALLISFAFLKSDLVAQTGLQKKTGSIRVATFNVALNRRNEGQLLTELESGKGKKISQVAAIIQLVRPDVLLLNEIDFDGGKTVEAFHDRFLAASQQGQEAIEYPHRFAETVNTGVDSTLDLNSDRRVGSAEDAFGYGKFPGQYGMAVLSKYPIKTESARTFQKFLWKDMPEGLLPVDPETNKSWFSAEALEVFRLSSKSHWDLPIHIDGQSFHLLVCHPTPPVFDGKEDRNGKRNHDEIRLWADYVNNKCDWLYDDKGVKGGLATDQTFVIAGDLNADPNDGDGYENAIGQLLKHDRIQADPIPSSRGGKHFAEQDGLANLKHKGDPANDTANFNDRSVGNVRIDYVLPSKGLVITNQGIFWPTPDQQGGDLAEASDHRMVWVDIELPK